MSGMEQDWATDLADEIVRYLSKCADRSEKVELLAAYLRHERYVGKLLATREYGKIFTESASAVRGLD